MPASRIEKRFAAARGEGRALFIGYLMAGDPDAETSIAAMQAVVDAGVDILEIGAPFTDPMADGPAIQRAALRSLRAGGSLSATLEVARRVRAANPDLPVIIMGYTNPIHAMGWAAFAERAHTAGVDGVIVVDLPPEEDPPLRAELARRGLAVIRLATPTTHDDRMKVVADGAAGFLYYVSVTGVTGAGVGAEGDIAAAAARARRISGLPVAAGFGVRTPEQAAAYARAADGVVVGSALVDALANAPPNAEISERVKPISVLAQSLSNAISRARF